MLVFIVPLKSKQVSNSWEHLSKVFERCVKSLCNQTLANFRVVVVCHEKPQIQFSHSYITYIEVDFPVPNINDVNAKRVDKVRKICLGLKYARQLEATYVMEVDADDCVSRRLVEFVDQRPQENGWFINRGYLYLDGSQFVYFKRKDFYLWCGSCNIVKCELHSLIEKNVEDIEIEFTKSYCPHRQVAEQLASRGNPIKPLPFAGAIYILNHGENLTNGNNNKLIKPKNGGVIRYLKRLLSYQPLTTSIRTEFGLYNI